MEVFKNIVDRFVIHFFASTSLVMLVCFALAWFARRYATAREFVARNFELILSALLVFAFSTTREAFDVANGQPLVKAVTDYASWLIGCGVSAWGLYRFRGSKP